MVYIEVRYGFCIFAEQDMYNSFDEDKQLKPRET